MDTESLSKSFENFFHLRLPKPLDESGVIQNEEFTIKYICMLDASEKTVLDLLIFDRHGFPPLHKRIQGNGEILDLENFQFSIMYEFPWDREKEELKMEEINQKTAHILINKGLAGKREEWIQKHL